jgi:hypothetical protein
MTGAAYSLVIFFFCIPLVAEVNSHSNRDSSRVSDSTGSTALFLEGLASDPETSKRKAAGEILEKSLKPHIEQIRKLKTADSAVLANVLEWTVEYAKGEKTCEPNEKITLYRGFGRHPFFGRRNPTPKAGEYGYMLNGTWLGEVISDVNARRKEGKLAFTDRKAGKDPVSGKYSLSGDDIGSVIYSNRGLLENFDIEKQNWRELTWEYSWSELTSVHTTGETSTILISTSVNASVANHFGPGFLTLSVCPQRAMLVNQLGDDFAEYEVYLPLIIFPEEIVKVEGEICGHLEDEEKKLCYGRKFAADKTSLAELSQAYHDCLMNRDIGLRTYSVKPVEDRYRDRINPVFYRLVGESSSSKDFLAKMPQIKTLCKPDCKVMREVRERILKAVAAFPRGPEAQKEANDAIKRADEFLGQNCVN